MTSRRGRTSSEHGALSASVPLRASAPLRADLAGGTLDIWPLSLLHEGAGTVNVALRIYARAEFAPGPRTGRRLELRAPDLGARSSVPVAEIAGRAGAAGEGNAFALVLRALAEAGAGRAGTVSTRVEGPPGGGIGGSSALLIASLALACRMVGRRFSRRHAADLARDLECQALGLPTGVQDYYPPLFGGVQHLRYVPGATLRRRLGVDEEALSRRLILAYSGQPHSSAPSNWRLLRARLEGVPAVVRAFDRIAAAASEAAVALDEADWPRLGAAMNADWQARKSIDAALAPKDLRWLERVGRRAGAIAAKGCGAASGGCMLFLVDAVERRARVEGALERAGAALLPTDVARRGVRVERQ